ncbi:MAG: hypothetical protein SFV23_12740 [Planctomycetaceae bacterium]|nr:hypothetical protein [Planctomycetaceae bacterium]
MLIRLGRLIFWILVPLIGLLTREVAAREGLTPRWKVCSYSVKSAAGTQVFLALSQSYRAPIPGPEIVVLMGSVTTSSVSAFPSFTMLAETEWL